MKKNKENRLFLLYISPWIIGFSIFTLFPMLFSLVMSFTNANVLQLWTDSTEFVGFKNYKMMFVNDLNFLKSISNTLIFTVFRVSLGLIFAFLIALFFNQDLFGKKIMRTLVFLPSLIPTVASALVWYLLLNEDAGLFNKVITAFGLEKIRFLSYDNALNSVILMACWNGVGPAMLIFLAGLQGVPKDLIEAATIDGASKLKILLKVTIPILSPTIIFLAITNIVGALQAYAEMDMLTGGGPGDATITMTMMVVGNAFDSSAKGLGFASAQSWFIFAIVMIFTLIMFKVNKKYSFYEEF